MGKLNQTEKPHYDLYPMIAFYFIFGVVEQELSIAEIKQYLISWYHEPWPSAFHFDFSWKALGLTLPTRSDGAFILPHEWVDDRAMRDTPVFKMSYSNRDIGLFVPNSYFWAEAGLLMGMQVILAAVTGYFVYHYIVMRPKFYDTVRYAVAACIVPFWLIYTFYLIKGLGIDNKIIRFMLSAVTPSMCIFRTTEALANQSPKKLTTSVKDFIIYFSSPMTPEYDKDTRTYVKASRAYVLSKMKTVFNNFVILSWLYSMCEVFPRTLTYIGPPYDLERWYSIKWLLMTHSTWICGMWSALFFFTLVATGEAGCLATCLITGYQIEPYFDNPTFKCRTMSELWGQRWNLMIQRVLKRGIYIPFCKLTNNTKWLALLCTFLASGVYHEWLVYIIMTLPTQEGPLDYPLVWGAAYFYFWWQGMICLMEMKFFPASWFEGEMPTLFKPFWAYCIAINGPYFLAPYVHTNFFRDGFVGYPLMQPIVNATTI